MDPKDDPEARIRELERSLSDVAGKSELTAAERGGYANYSAVPTTRTSRGFRRSRVVLLVVAIVAVALAVLCGKYNNGPDLLWTQNKDLLIGDIQGPDLNALFQFWRGL